LTDELNRHFIQREIKLQDQCNFNLLISELIKHAALNSKANRAHHAKKSKKKKRKKKKTKLIIKTNHPTQAD
jgi:hypothetical protein